MYLKKQKIQDMNKIREYIEQNKKEIIIKDKEKLEEKSIEQINLF